MSNIHNTARLDSVTAELNGVTLIEAAAGTGKTYNIQNLTARLIVEKDLKLSSLVIVTFTEKAAKELSDRLRKVLVLLTDALNGKMHSDLQQQQRAEELIARFDALGISREQQLERLNDALRDFDDNRISTIHGFCARVLSENAFESSVAFRVRLEKNIDEYIEKLLGDFCRIYRYGENKLPGLDDISVEELRNPVKIMFQHGKLRLNMQRKLYKSADEIWQALENLKKQFFAIEDPLAGIRALHGRINKTNGMDGKEYLEHCEEAIDRVLRNPDSSWHDFYNTYKLLLPDIFRDKGKAANDNKEYVNNFVTNNQLFKLSEEYCRTIEVDCRIFMQLQALDFVRTRLAQWKERENFQGFDDLLAGVHSALQNKNICRVLQNKFKAGIIDEFQDTDALQYEIFKQLFINRADPSFFMVGDPRQAIYSFRGGDLATYMSARRECIASGGRVYTLDINYRSSARLIGEFNRIFAHKTPFASDEIVFNTAYAPENSPAGIAFEGNEVKFPLAVDYCPDSSSEDLYSKCADEILAMLNSRSWTLPDKDGSMRPVTPGDIAVLAYDSYALEAVREKLERYNIPVVGERKSGIWNSPEADELATVMTAVLSGGDRSSICEALLTRIGGRTLYEIDATDDEATIKISAWMLDFKDMDQVWHESGTASFMRILFDRFAIKESLSGQIGGDRALANYTQLGDMLASAELARHLSPRGVLNFLQEKIARSNYDDESAEMLESDHAAVKLMTIHRSKGLQFPVVFLPQLAKRYPLQKDGLKIYHQGMELYCNPDQLDSAGMLTAGIEELQEIMRLVYVAVTRACSFCRISWGKCSKNRKVVNCTPMHWLFGVRSCKPGELAVVLRSFLGFGGKCNILIDIPQYMLQEFPFGFSEKYTYTPDPENSPLIMPDKTSMAVNSWKIMSYSSLPFHRNAENSVARDLDNAIDRDEDESETAAGDIDAPAPVVLNGGIWSVPRGAGVGNAWHEILENMDFTLEVNRQNVAHVMRLYGFGDPVHHAAACEMFEKLRGYTLPCGMCFSDLTPSRRLNELEFLLTSPDGISFKKMCDAVNGYLESEFGETLSGDEPLLMSGGFFTGFIDMLFEYQGKFYIVDWKSNDLGGVPEAFYGSRLKQEISRKCYHLQYLCYLAALLKYLELRLKRTFDEKLYEQYVGGVYYIFLRGMMLDTPGGVFSAQVPYSVVRKLADVITSGKENDK